MDENSLVCTANAEWTTAAGTTTRKLALRRATLRLIRNENRQMYLELTAEKSAPVRLECKGITVHKKYMNEGKACIKFLPLGCSVFLSNAPPGQLLTFLRTVFVKMTGTKADAVAGGAATSLRAQLLSNKPRQFDEISPVTTVDLQKAQRKAVGRSTDTTPSPLSRKRKLSTSTTGERDGGTAPKRVHGGVDAPLLREELNEQQREVLSACLAGHNVFFTGSAGTGKSFLLRKIIRALPPDVTQATASTGVAACHIGGITLHQFAGIGGGEATLERSCQLASKTATASIWRKCKHLIIDEISMVDGHYFDKIEAVARHVRKSDKPFGGIQLILCGDFFQLPPVYKGKGTDRLPFAFQAQSWQDCVRVCFELTRVHRQADPTFINILNSIRVGKATEEVVQKLSATSKQNIETAGILATRLCSHTQDANTINESKLSSLQGELKTFEAIDSDKYMSKQLDQQTPVPYKLVLKTGAQVMLLKNVSVGEGLVNGARGVVTEFKDNLPLVKFRNKTYLVKQEKFLIKTAGGATLSRNQVPLKLAWAFSIHKSQGLTLDCVEMALGRVFEAGQAYVALSRAQSLETLRVLDFKGNQVWANADVLKFNQRLRQQIEETRLFVLGDRTNRGGRNDKAQIVKSIAQKLKSGKAISKKLFDKPLVSIR